MRKSSFFFLVLSLSLMMVACGGGDLDSSDDDDPTAPVATALVPASNATDVSEYRVLYGSTQFDERVFSAGAWSDPIDSNLLPRAFGSDGVGYAVLGEEIDGVNRTLYSISRSATGWSLPLPILTLTDERFLSIVLDGSAGLYRPMWTQPASTEAIAQRLWLLPDN